MIFQDSPRCVIMGAASIDFLKESHAVRTHALLNMCEEKLEELAVIKVHLFFNGSWDVNRTIRGTEHTTLLVGIECNVVLLLQSDEPGQTIYSIRAINM